MKPEGVDLFDDLKTIKVDLDWLLSHKVYTAKVVKAASVVERSIKGKDLANVFDIPALSIGDHSISLFGGFIASYKPELGTLSEQNPKSRMMSLITKKLTGLLKFSSELSDSL